MYVYVLFVCTFASSQKGVRYLNFCCISGNARRSQLYKVGVMFGNEWGIGTVWIGDKDSWVGDCGFRVIEHMAMTDLCSCPLSWQLQVN